jgi:hypothetical protein
MSAEDLGRRLSGAWIETTLDEVSHHGSNTITIAGSNAST